MKEKLRAIREDALKQIENSDALEKLNEVRVNFLGKKGELTSVLKSMKDVAPEDRPMVGQLVNETREAIEKILEEKKVIVNSLQEIQNSNKEITDTLLSGRSVILNLEGLHVDIAQRIIDFTSGSCYSINGNLQKISSYIFIITPESVEISGDFQELLGSGFDVATFK